MRARTARSKVFTDRGVRIGFVRRARGGWEYRSTTTGAWTIEPKTRDQAAELLALAAEATR